MAHTRNLCFAFDWGEAIFLEVLDTFGGWKRLSRARKETYEESRRPQHPCV